MAHASSPTLDTLAYLKQQNAMPAAAIIAVEFAGYVSKWVVRHRTRKALRQLTDWQLRDVGLTPRQAQNEAAKVFWRA